MVFQCVSCFFSLAMFDQLNKQGLRTKQGRTSICAARSHSLALEKEERAVTLSNKVVLSNKLWGLASVDPWYNKKAKNWPAIAVFKALFFGPSKTPMYGHYFIWGIGHFRWQGIARRFEVAACSNARRKKITSEKPFHRKILKKSHASICL